MNPLAKYKDKEKLTWKELSRRCQSYPSQMSYIMRMEAPAYEGITLGTAARIKRGTGVDFFSTVEDLVSGT